MNSLKAFLEESLRSQLSCALLNARYNIGNFRATIISSTGGIARKLDSDQARTGVTPVPTVKSGCEKSQEVYVPPKRVLGDFYYL